MAMLSPFQVFDRPNLNPTWATKKIIYRMLKKSLAENPSAQSMHFIGIKYNASFRCVI